MIARACKCGGLIRDGECNRCGPVRATEYRGNSNERGYGAKWRYESERYKRRHPLCVCCEAQGKAMGQRGRLGILVDHVVPVAIAPELFWDRSNWQTLCHDCDGRYKKPIERRCGTANGIRQAWGEVLEGLKNATKQRAGVG